MLALVLLAIAAPDDAFTLMGRGNGTCRTWTARATLGGQDRTVDKQWLAGFLSGANLVAKVSGDGDLNSANDDFDAMVSFVDGECRLAPDQVIGQAAQQVVVRLLQRKLQY